MHLPRLLLVLAAFLAATSLLQAGADYAVSTSFNGIVVTDTKGNSDRLEITESAPAMIQFASAGRTFSLNNGPEVLGNSGPISLLGHRYVIVYANAGDDQIEIGSFATPINSLTINGGSGDDAVGFSGSFDIASGGLDIDLQNDAATPGWDSIDFAEGARVRTLDSKGAIICRCSCSISLGAGAGLETAGGDLTMEANQQETSPVRDFSGVSLNGGFLRVSGQGVLTVKGRGGLGPLGSNSGIRLFSGGKITGGTGRVELIATGRGAVGSGSNHGLELVGPNSEISSGGGNINIVGSAGRGEPLGLAGSWGIHIADSAEIHTPGAGGDISCRSNSFFIAPSSRIATAATSSVVYVHPRVFPSDVATGEEDSLGTPDTLGLASAELDRIYCNSLAIGTQGTRVLRLKEAIIRPPGGRLVLGQSSYSSAGSGIAPCVLGTDVWLGDAGALELGSHSPLRIDIVSLDGEPQSPRLSVVGGVNLGGAPLCLSSSVPGAAGDTFLIVENDGSDPIVGQFSTPNRFPPPGLFPTPEGTRVPEGGFVGWPGSSALVGRLSYAGGTGNDVVLTLTEFDPGLLVVTNANDSGPGSLRSALACAEARAGQDVVSFSPAMAGATITLNEEISVSDPEPVSVDASSLSAPVIISGGGKTRLFLVQVGADIRLTGLKLCHGNGMGGADNLNGGAIFVWGAIHLVRCEVFENATCSGGAMQNNGVAVLEDCTFRNNLAEMDCGEGGAINNFGRLSISRCTFVENAASAELFARGGAIFNDSELQLTSCTFAANRADFGGGAIFNNARMSAVHCTFSLNVAGSYDGAIENDGPLALDSCIVAGNTPDTDWAEVEYLTSTGNFFGPVSWLGPLGYYGGLTKTMPLLPGSPARNAARSSTATSDQRGFSVVGFPDIGSYESGASANCAAYLWETLPGTASAAQHAGAADFDGDGSTNEQEWLALTNPGQAASVFRIVSAQRNGETLNISFRSAVGRQYTLWQEEDLDGVWVNTGLPAIPGDGALRTFSISGLSGAAVRRFYRVQAAP